MAPYSSIMSKCPGCGADFPHRESPPNRYGIASPECWAVLNERLAHERNQWGYPDVHRLVVDAYSVQHPQNFPLQKELGISERLIEASVQSVAMHLIALYFALVEQVKLSDISKLMNRILSRGATFEPLTPPEHLGKFTVADVPRTDDLEVYSAFAWKWAEEAWNAWSAHHDQVKKWINQYLNGANWT